MNVINPETCEHHYVEIVFPYIHNYDQIDYDTGLWCPKCDDEQGEIPGYFYRMNQSPVGFMELDETLYGLFTVTQYHNRMYRVYGVMP